MLNSEWLIRMLAKSGRTPEDKLLALFDILADWIDAPHMRQLLANSMAHQNGCEPLLEFLTEQARAIGASHPDMLAHQLYLMALGALHEELRTPGCSATLQAKSAAGTLLLAHRRQAGTTKPMLQRSVVAAAFMILIGIGILVPGAILNNPGRIDNSLASPEATTSHAPVAQKASQINPVQVASLVDAIEQLHKGVCQYPQALMLPSEQRSAFLDVVVDGAISVDNFTPQELHQLVRKVDCYYPPVALLNS